MNKIRVMLVDDAVVIRRMVTDVLSADPAVDVVGSAPNGRVALTKLPLLNPDIVVMDIEMPEMDGLETVTALRKTHPRLPVIMFSTLTQRGATATLDALARGANDYVTKPANVGSVGEGLQRIRDQLIPKIKALCGRSAAPAATKPVPTAAPRAIPVPPPEARAAVPPAPGGRIEVLGIGVSTGGPNALSTVIPALPRDFPVPVLIVQHMPPIFTKMLAERLATRTSMPVCEGAEGEVLKPGHVYIAPGDSHMLVARERATIRLRLTQGPPENSCRPAVDPLFRSLVEVYGSSVLGVIMTGMGQDGLIGCERIRAVGGQVLVQDEASSVVWGMPGAVARAGLATSIHPLDELGLHIVRVIRRARVAAAS